MHFTVEANYAGWRLDKYLSEKINRLSRTRIQAIIMRDLQSEVPLKSSTHVWPGLTFALRKRAALEPKVPSPEELRQLYVDEDILVLDKPAGLPVHPSARYQRNTLTAQIIAKFGFRAEPAHRLDRETSGLIVCARTSAASRALGIAFQDGAVTKEYLALVVGWPDDAFEVDAPISKGTEAVRIAVCIDPLGAPAQTRFLCEARFSNADSRFALVRCFPMTGRQHQIRIHAAHCGHPLVGDKMYGGHPAYFDRFSKGLLTAVDWEALQLPRHALHAARLAFAHPRDKRPMVFSSPLPDDLAAFVGAANLKPLGRS